MPALRFRNSSVSAGCRPASSALSFSLRSGASTTAFHAACASGFAGGVAVACGVGTGCGGVVQANRQRSNPTAENIARMIFEHARRAGFPVVEVQLVEQEGSIAGYAP